MPTFNLGMYKNKPFHFSRYFKPEKIPTMTDINASFLPINYLAFVIQCKEPKQFFVIALCCDFNDGWSSTKHMRLRRIEHPTKHFNLLCFNYKTRVTKVDVTVS